MATFIVTFQCQTHFSSHVIPVTTNQDAENREEAKRLVKEYFQEVGYEVLNCTRIHEVF
jgi:hypothetical protein